MVLHVIHVQENPVTADLARTEKCVGGSAHCCLTSVQWGAEGSVLPNHEK